jgi:hypothetical protein
MPPTLPSLQKLNSLFQDPKALFQGLHFPTAGPLATLFMVVKIIFIILDALLAFGFVWALAGLISFRPKFNTPTGKEEQKTLTIKVQFFRERWQEILKRVESETPEAMRIAIIEADALVDTALKDAGIKGEHMADRLAVLDFEEVKSLEQVWSSHRLRNDIAHTPGFTVSREDAISALKGYEAFLREIEAL